VIKKIQFLDKKEDFNIEDLYGCIELISNVHSKYWNSRRFKGDLAWVQDWREPALLFLGLGPSWIKAKRLMGHNFNYECNEIMELILSDILRFFIILF